MVSKRNKPDWPPPGWKVEIKRKNGRNIKFYINSKTCQKFYSKPALLRYIREECVRDENFQPIIEHAKKSSGEIQMHLVEENEFDWLPTGWVLERRIRKSGVRVGTEYKCYIDPLTGTKFFSKPEVLRYLAGSSGRKDRRGSGQSSSKRSVVPLSAHESDLEPNVSQISKTRVRKSLSSGNIKVVTERTVDEDLPSGWIKETRIKMLGNKVVKRNPSYNDPDSRLVFRSKLEVLRYLETGEISRHAYQRKSGSIIGKDSANGKMSTSSEREETPKSRIRKTLFAGEASSEQSIQALAEAGSDKEDEGRKSRRSSARVRPAPAGASSSKQSTLSPESASNSQEMKASSKREETPKRRTRQSIQALPEAGGNEKAEGRKSGRLSSRLRPAPAAASSSKQSTLSPESASNSQEMEVAKPLLENLSGTKETVGVTTHAPSEVQDAGAKVATLEMSEPPAAPSRGILPEENPVALAIQGCSNGKRETGKRKAKDRKLPCVPSRSSKRLAGVDAKVVFHPIPIELALRDTSRNTSRAKPIPNLELVPNELQEKCQDVDKQDVLAFQEEKHQTLYVNAESVLTTEGEPSKKVDDFPSLEEKHRKVDFNPETVLATEGESSNKNDDLTSLEEKHHPLMIVPEIVLAHGEASNKNDDDFLTKDNLLVDLDDLQLEQAPPGFSENTKVEVSSNTIKQPLEHPPGTLLGSKIENTSRGRPILGEKLASIEKESEQPQSEFCFPSPLWSDPCLEFAFKTLTGAIPFDDNLAIQDYIQHQLRTSEEIDNSRCLPDVCTPSVFKSDETIIVSQLPEDVNVPNSNGFGSPEIKQVKDK